MKNKHPFVTFARKLRLTSLIATFVALTSAAGVVNAQSPSSDAYQTAANYVTTFYPLWFTHNQSIKAKPNQLIGPKNVTPLYQTVVAVNVDTLYASSFMQLPSNDAAILTIPAKVTIPSTNTTIATSALSYSVLILDPYGNIIHTGVNFTPGVYVFVGPTFNPSSQVNPSGATVVNLPVDHPSIIFRADKYVNGQDETLAADAFRSSLQMQFLSVYNSLNPAPSQTEIVSELTYAVPFKVIADTELSLAPMTFLSQLMEAVAADSSFTPTLSFNDAALSEHFNELYNSAAVNADLAAGAVAAHQQIVRNYLGHRDANGWIDFTNIGQWGTDVIDRASITEFLQFGNDFSAATYFHVFVDGNGQALDGSKSGYVIHFPPNQPPAAKRFWSITAYTPEAVELVPNVLDKYNIASYTRGLTKNSDGSLTIYVGTSRPEGVPESNYLPAPPRLFNLMMRFYGPQGQVAAGAYVPPPVMPQN